MIQAYICRQCRLRLAQRLPPVQLRRWKHSESFISLRKTPPTRATREESQNTQPQGSWEEGNKGRTQKPDDGRFDSNQNPSGNDKSSTGVGRYSRLTVGGLGKLEVEGQHATRNESAPKAPPPTNHSGRSPGFHKAHISENPSHAVLLDRHLKSADLTQAWSLFCDAYTSKDCQALLQPSSQDIIQLNGGRQRGQNIFGRLLRSTVTEFCKGAKIPVSPTAVLFNYEQLGISQVEFWRDTIGTLTDRVLMHTSNAQQLDHHVEGLLAELLSLWRLYFQFKGEYDVPLESIDTEWKAMPDADTLKEPIGDWSITRDVCMRIQHYYPRSMANPVLGFSAVVLFNILNQGTHNTIMVSDALRTQSAPFSRLMAHILAGANVQSVIKHVGISNNLKMLPKESQSTIIDEIKETPSNVMLMMGSRVFEDPTASAFNRAVSLEAYIFKRIERATKEQSEPRRLDKLWKEVVRVYTKDGKTSIPRVMYNAFLAGYLKLLVSDRSVEVWNHMLQHGIQPDVKTWTAMIDGCAKAKDTKGMNAMWMRMIQSGIQPDAYAWASRIHGLLSARLLNDGYAAMDEMGNKWRTAEVATRKSTKPGKQQVSSAPKPINNYAKPTIEVINAATSAIIALPERSLQFDRKVDAVRKILQWASPFGLKLDTRTYNILIKLYLSKSDFDTTFGLLRQMDANGVQADIATYTMLVHSSFDYHEFNNLSEDEQASRIQKIFSDLEAGGMTLNSYIYSSTIDRLLKYHGNFTAVRQVIDHMMSKGWVPSPHIYTSLMTHYFQENPPNVAAVDSLLYQIISRPGTPTDKIFFDRVIEGYAKVGEIGKMMAVLVRMGSHGKLPGWQALTAVLQALIETGDWERARSVVRDVSQGEGVAQKGITGTGHGQHAFFSLVKASGLEMEHMQQGGGEQQMHTGV